MTVEVIVPWQDSGCPHRAAALRWVLDHLAAMLPRWALTVAETPPGRWIKGDAVGAAVERSSAEWLVIHDADVWCEATWEAVELYTPRLWAIPHDRVYRLDAKATGSVLVGEARPSAFMSINHLTENHYRGVAGGGIVVLRRDTYNAVPLDRRFVGWGGEDQAWGWALDTLIGPPSRGATPLFHLYHPPQPRQDRKIGNAENEALRVRYRSAVGTPERMVEIIGEAKSWPASGSN